MKFPRLLAIALGVLSTGSALAHGIWTETRRGDLEVVYGHGAEDEAYAPERIKEVWAYAPDGHSIPTTVERRQDHVRLVPLATPAVVSVAMDNGIWSKGPDGKSVNASMTQVAGATSASHSYKYSLAILQAHARLPTDLRMAMLIRPLRDPTTVGVGKPLPVEVTIDGKPAPDIALFDDYRALADASSVRTDARGRANVIIRNAGLNVIAAQARVPSTREQGVTERSLSTSLTFVGERHSH